MKNTHRKTFSDRYAMLHEQQVLDYLNQRHAPVPKVIVSHLEQSYLDMDHGGKDLQAWIQDTRPSPQSLSKALSLAVQAAMRVAELGVWHVDIALRNFVIQDAENSEPTVLLIDFSNAISQQFPLQKPLWMLPTAQQHPLLRQSLILDWQAFYARHQLPSPTHWDQAFDVPVKLYQEDWTCGLQVEAISNRWCILAHSLGQMILQVQSNLDATAQTAHRTWAPLLDLRDDPLARQRLEQCLHLLAGSPIFEQSTPRPHMTADRMGMAAIGESPAPHDPHPKKTLSLATRQRGSLRWLGHAFNLAVIGLGWLLIDAIYTVHGLILSWLSWLGIATALLGTAIGMMGILVSRHRYRWWSLMLLTQPAAQALLWLEMWALGLPTFNLGIVAACASVSVVLTLACRMHKQVGSEIQTKASVH